MHRRLLHGFSVVFLLAAGFLVFSRPARTGNADLPSTWTEAADARLACGWSTAAPARYDHVVWIMEENKSLADVVGKAATPFLSNLANTCAYSTNYVDNEPRSLLGKGYHSLSHYVALLSGSDCAAGNGLGPDCVTNDAKSPLAYALPTESLFQQVQKTGLTWKSYQESAPASCSMRSKGKYAARHDAALYFLPIREACRNNDVPVPAYNLKGTPSGTLIDDIVHDRLPTFAYVTPNLAHDMHDGTPRQADAWLEAYLTPLFNSQTYRQGRTAVFILWDESSLNNKSIANVFVAPSVRGGAVKVVMSGFSVLGTTEDLLGLPHLGCASGQPPGGQGSCYAGATADLRAAFGL